MGKKTVLEVRVKDVEKRRYPNKHYMYVLEVSWSEGSSTTVYRRYSDFFEFQCELLERFPEEAGVKDPAHRMIPFLPGKKLFGRSQVRSVAEKRKEKIGEYCRALIRLPPKMSEDQFVLDFFEVTTEDIHPPTKTQKSKTTTISAISEPMLLERYVAIADYEKQKKNECNLMAGQQVEVIDKNENGWWFVNLDDFNEGWVPATFLEPLYGTEDPRVEVLEEVELYITKSAYTAQHHDEATFEKGVLVEVFEKGFDGWWKIQYKGKGGLAPAAYLQKYHGQALEAATPAQVVSSVKEAVQTASGGASPHLSSSRTSPNKPKQFAPTWHSQAKPYIDKEPIYGPTPRRYSIKKALLKKKVSPAATTTPIAGSWSPTSPTDEFEFDVPEPVYEIIPEPEEEIFITIGDFTATAGDGLSFEAGLLATIITKNPTGWWFVEIDGMEGWVPSSYLEKKQSKPNSPVRKQTSPVATSPVHKPTSPVARSTSPIHKPTSPVARSTAKVPPPPPTRTKPTPENKPFPLRKITPESKPTFKGTHLSSKSSESIAIDRIKPTKPVTKSPSSDNILASSKAVFTKSISPPSRRKQYPGAPARHKSAKPMISAPALIVSSSSASQPRKVSAPHIDVGKSPPTIRTIRKMPSADELETKLHPVPTPRKTSTSSDPPRPVPRTSTTLHSGTKSSFEVPTHGSRTIAVGPRAGRTTPDETDGRFSELERALLKRSGAPQPSSKGGPPQRPKPYAADSSRRVPPKRPEAPKNVKKPGPPRPANSPALKKKATYLTICDYDGSTDGCLSFREGEKVDVIEKNDDGWWYVKIGVKEGWAPSTFMEDSKPKPARPSTSPALKRKQIPVPKPRPRASKVPNMYRAVASYEVPPYEDSGLQLIEGRLYEVMQQSDEGWWYVKDGGMEGWAPASYLEQAYCPQAIKAWERGCSLTSLVPRLIVLKR